MEDIIDVTFVLKTGVKITSKYKEESLNKFYERVSFRDTTIFRLVDDENTYFVTGDRVDYIQVPRKDIQ